MKQALASQYVAALKMMQLAVIRCPEQLWADVRYDNAYRQIVYHALYFTALYLSGDENEFIAPDGHIAGSHRLGVIGMESVFSKADLQHYAIEIAASVAATINAQDLNAPSGFEWLPMNKLELHLYNIRHIQHHTGQLIERLHQNGIGGIDWIGFAVP